MVFFFSLLFCQFLIRNFLKAIEIVIHSLIQRISMQIGLEMNAKNTNRTRKRSLHCVQCSDSVASFHTEITMNI